jgi:hypothetical protein
MKLKSNIAISDNGFVFDPTTGDSFNLNYTGVEILKMIKNGNSETEMIENILKKYDVDKETVEHNVFDFIRMLSHFNLIEENNS